jgi:hypothetical protein
MFFGNASGPYDSGGAMPNSGSGSDFFPRRNPSQIHITRIARFCPSNQLLPIMATQPKRRSQHERLLAESNSLIAWMSDKKSWLQRQSDLWRVQHVLAMVIQSFFNCHLISEFSF